MNNKNGELTKKAEMLEMDFLKEMGVDTLGKYIEIENHIDKITDILIGENDDLNIVDGYGVEDIEEMEQEIEDKSNAIDSASADLSEMKRFVKSMKKSDIKTNLMDCIERMEIDLC